MAKMQKAKTTKPKATDMLAGLNGGYHKGYVRNRVIATLIDFFIVTVLCMYAMMLFGEPNWPAYIDMQEAVVGLTAKDPLVIERMALFQRCFIVTLIIGGVYEALMLVFFKGTLGKLITGLRVENLNPERNFWLGKLMLILRSLIKVVSIYLISAIPFIFMSLSVFGNNKGQSGFDLAVRTFVADKRKVKTQGQEG